MFNAGALLLRFFPQPLWHHESVQEPEVYLGTARLVSRAFQSSALGWTRDRKYCVGFAGYISNLTQLARAHSSGLADGQDTIEAIVTLFRVKGIPGLAELSGVFAMAVWNAKERTLTLATDRASLAPLYWGQFQSGYAFG